MNIATISATAIRIPVERATAFSTRVVGHREYVLVTVESDSGVVGTGYTYAGTTGGIWLRDAVTALIAPVIHGRKVAAIDECWEIVYRELLLLGRRGGLLRALSAVEIALWDAVGRAAGLPVRRLLGGHRHEIPAYASGGYYHDGDPLDNVSSELARYGSDGFTRFKIKVGGAPLDVDVARVRTARETIGDGGQLALDANNAWRSSDEALRAANAFAPYDIWWLEEPLMPDDVHGHAELARRAPMAIATGEIEATRWGFAELLRSDACQIAQPDACVAGGIGEWLKIANTAASFGRPVAPHWHANLHAQLAACVPNCLAIEYFALREDIYNFEAIVSNPLQVRNGHAILDETPGIGVDYHPALIEQYRIQ